MTRTWRNTLRQPLWRWGVVAGMLVAPLSKVAPASVVPHAELKSSLPSAGAHLGIVPRELRLTFTEAPELGFSTVSLAGPGGIAIPLGSVRVASASPMTLVVAIPGAVAAGTYTVKWKIAGADGHPVDGQFDFTVAPGAEGTTTGSAPSQPGSATRVDLGDSAAMSHGDPTALPSSEGFDAESPGYVLVRWLLYAGLLLIIGPVAFQFAVVGALRRTPHANMHGPMLARMSARAASFGFVGAVAVVGAVLLRLFAQSFAMHGTDRAFDGTLVASMLTTTTWGTGWMLQFGGALVAVAGFFRARQRRSFGWNAAALAALVLAFTPALSGHAVSAPQLSKLAVLADGLHVMGAGGWLGSLLVVISVGIPATFLLEPDKRSGAVAELINAFSPTALVFATMLVVTGVFAAWLHLRGVSALWQTSYGQTLLLKLALVGLVAATGAYNWRRIKPRLGEPQSVRHLQRSGKIELAFSVLVLLATALLVATPPAT